MKQIKSYKIAHQLNKIGYSELNISGYFDTQNIIIYSSNLIHGKLALPILDNVIAFLQTQYGWDFNGNNIATKGSILLENDSIEGLILDILNFECGEDDDIINNDWFIASSDYNKDWYDELPDNVKNKFDERD